VTIQIDDHERTRQNCGIFSGQQLGIGSVHGKTRHAISLAAAANQHSSRRSSAASVSSMQEERLLSSARSSGGSARHQGLLGRSNLSLLDNLSISGSNSSRSSKYNRSGGGYNSRHTIDEETTTAASIATQDDASLPEHQEDKESLVKRRYIQQVMNDLNLSTKQKSFRIQQLMDGREFDEQPTLSSTVDDSSGGKASSLVASSNHPDQG